MSTKRQGKIDQIVAELSVMNTFVTDNDEFSKIKHVRDVMQKYNCDLAFSKSNNEDDDIEDVAQAYRALHIIGSATITHEERNKFTEGEMLALAFYKIAMSVDGFPYEDNLYYAFIDGAS